MSIHKGRQDEAEDARQNGAWSIEQIGVDAAESQGLDDGGAPGRQSIDGLKTAQAGDEVRPGGPVGQDVGSVGRWLASAQGGPGFSTKD